MPLQPNPFIFCLLYLLLGGNALAQKDTIKYNWGINNFEIGVAKTSDIVAKYKKACRVSSSKNSQTIRVRNMYFRLYRIDTSYILSSIYIKLNHQKWYFSDKLSISNTTKCKDVLAVIDSFTIGHTLDFNTVVYKETYFKNASLTFKMLPVKGNERSTDSYPLEETLFRIYKDSKIKGVVVSSTNFDFVPVFEKEEKKPPQLLYSGQGDYVYYKDKDSLLRIEIFTGCMQCSRLPVFSVYFYDKKKRLKTEYVLHGYYIPLNLQEDCEKILKKLIEGALIKEKFIYAKNNKTTVVRYHRENIKSPFFVGSVSKID